MFEKLMTITITTHKTNTFFNVKDILCDFPNG